MVRRLAMVIALVVVCAGITDAQSFVINGKSVKLPTIVKGGSAFVDAAALAKALGASVTNNKATKQYVISLGGAPGSVGTVQMAGGWGELGKEYSIGGDSPMNFALKSAEFSVGQVRIGDDLGFPKADEKLLVLRYTIHNPRKTDQSASWSTFDMTAVDASDNNCEYSQNVGQETNSGTLNLYLKPAQKVEAYTYIRVPAKGEIPKLIVKRGSNNPVVRYDLKGKVKPLSAPFADPSDSTGATAFTQVPAQFGSNYPLGNFDLKVESAAYTNQPVLRDAPKSGYRYLVATLLIKNQHPKEKSVSWSTFQPTLQAEDGENLEWNQHLVSATRAEDLNIYAQPGQEVKARIYFLVRTDTPAKTLSIQEGKSRAYLFDISGVK